MRHWCFRSRFVSGVFLLMIAMMTACSHREKAAGQYLYAAIPETGQILVYPLSASGPAQPVATIKESPPDKPIDASVDMSGEVFVANENGNVRAYGGQNFHYQLIHTLTGPHTQIVHPTAIVTNLDGTFYVADADVTGEKARVEWFPAGQNGNVFPNRVIAGPHTGITSPRGLALDGSGRLFVADQATNKLLVFKSDANGDEAPLLVLSGFHSPDHLFVDQLLNIYVSNKGNDTIAVFTTTGPQSWARSGTMRSVGMRQPAGLAVDQSGEIVVAGIGGILFFRPDADGQIKLAGDLRGPSPMNPAGISIR